MLKNRARTFILYIMLIFLIINLICINTTYCSSINDLTGENVPTEVQDKIDKVGNGVITLITTVGSIISVIVLIVIGIKYMMGSVEEKAEYKKTLLPFVIGAIILFGCSNLAGIIYNIAINL